MLNMSCSDQCFGLEKQFNAAMYKHLHLEAKKRPWLIRMSAFPIALTSSLISLATRIVAIAESVFKGLGNMFGFILSKNCSFVTGLKQIFFEFPKNLFKIFLILYKQLFSKIIVGILCPIAILAILIVNSLTKLSLFWNRKRLI